MKPSKRRVQEALIGYLEQGLHLSTACALLGISRRTVYEWMQRDARFLARVQAARAQPIARAERVLQHAIESGDTRVVMWYLERVCPAYRLPKGEAVGGGVDKYTLELEVVDAEAADVEQLIEEALRQ